MYCALTSNKDMKKNYGHGEQTFAKVNTESTTAVIHYSNFYI